MNKNTVTAGLSFALATFLAGCTTQLGVVQLPTNPTTPEGLVYCLPHAEYEIALTRELRSCRPEPADPLMRAWLSSELDNFDLVKDQLTNLVNRPFSTRAALRSEIASRLGEAAEAVQPLAEEFAKSENDQILLDRVALNQILRDFLDRHLLSSPSGYEVYWPRGFKTTRDGLRAKKDAGQAAETLRAFVGELGDGDFGYQVKVGYSVAVTPRFLPDLDHTYALDYQSMASPLKKTEFDFEKYPNGTLKSINATVEDRTAEVVAKTLRGALDVAAQLGGFALPAAPAPAATPPSTPQAAGQTPRAPKRFDQHIDEVGLCRSDVVAALSTSARLGRERSRGAKELAALERFATGKTAERNAVKEALDEAKAADEKLEVDGVAAGDERRRELSQRIAGLAAKKAELDKTLRALAIDRRRLENAADALTLALSRAVKPLRVESVHVFDPRPPALASEITGADRAARQWFRADSLARRCGFVPGSCYSDPAAGRDLPRDLRVQVAAYLPQGRPASPFPTKVDTSHLVYREPVRGELLICKRVDCLQSVTDGDGKTLTTRNVAAADLIHTQIVDFPQLGVLSTLPLVNKPFQNNTLVAAFSEAGALTSLSYRTNARAEKAAELVEASTGTVSDFLAAEREAQKNRLSLATEELEAEKARLEAELAVEKARAELDAFRRGDEPEDDPDGNP